MSATETLSIQAQFSEIRARYEADTNQSSYNALIAGESGTGKSFLLSTARKPVFIDSFDPGGSKCLRPWIEKGEILVDTRWEHEPNFKPKGTWKPTVYEEWAKVTNERKKNGFYNHLGTYVVDSGTRLADAIMNFTLGKRGAAGNAPQWEKDYTPQKVLFQNAVQALLSLPCDFIMTGHLEPDKDEVTGKVTWRYMATGKATVAIPLLFDEIYVTLASPKGQGVEYKLLTAGAGRYLARSRLAQEGRLDTYEEPNIKKILRKAGLPTDDKPLFVS